MNTTQEFDWSLIRAFVAVAETGSYSAAARQLGSSQPTIGRQIEALEAQLGTRLLEREARGQRVSEAGARLLVHAEEMRQAAARLSLSVAGQGEDLSGTVRITASIVVSHYFLPPIIADLRRNAPEISIELAPSDATENLLFREADIAVRMYRPTQLDVVTRHVGSVEVGIFATTDYLAQHGIPETLEDFAHHDFVGYDRSTLILDGMRAMGIPAEREMFKVRCDNQTVYVQLLEAGCGLGVIPIAAARRNPEMQQVLHQTEIPALPIWLTAHEDLRRVPRIRRVFDALADGLPVQTGPV